MTAIDQLRTWFNSLERLPQASTRVGDTVDARAILELADRLDKLEADAGPMASLLRYKTAEQVPPIAPLAGFPSANESPPEPFRITQPGRYQIVYVCDGSAHPDMKLVPSTDSSFPWCESGNEFCRFDDAGMHIDGRYRISAGPLSDEPDTAGLTGYVGIVPLGEFSYATVLSTVTEHGLEGATVIDLSTIRKDQLVKPEPKRETRKVVLDIWPDGRADVVRYPKTISPHPNLVARIEREIEYTVGEGLS